MKKSKCIAFTVTGFISLFLSFTLYFAGNFKHASSAIYGGDAYTGIQNASADAANNIAVVGQILNWGFCNQI